MRHPLYRRLAIFTRLPTLVVVENEVDRHGFAPCSPACEAGDLLNDRAAQNGNLVAGAGIEPARRRLMRPLPSHLAPPHLGKVARRLGAAPSPQSFGDDAAQA